MCFLRERNVDEKFRFSTFLKNRKIEKIKTDEKKHGHRIGDLRTFVLERPVRNLSNKIFESNDDDDDDYGGGGNAGSGGSSGIY
ncbi:hypothetical protein M0802_004397 [Mischocyttarus mexicanus]|nr:hypothetical protein M0802_004397 [Mischocyttarus mexicanus]